jgi:hypothetical protein
MELGGAGRAAYLRRAACLRRDRRARLDYSMKRAVPSGRVENGLEVFVHEQPTEFGIRTTSGPTPFVYDYRFATDGQDTIVHLDASVELAGVAGVLGPLAARAVRHGVDANFTALKRTLEGNTRTTTRAVEGRSRDASPRSRRTDRHSGGQAGEAADRVTS